MANLRKLSWVDILLVIVVVVGAVIAFQLSGTNSNAEKEKAQQETRARAVETSLSPTDKAASLESLRQSLEQVRSTLAKKPLPGEADALDITNEILDYTETHKITITRWDSSYTSTSLKEKQYPAISHSFSLQSKADELIGFIKALSRMSVTPVVQNLTITKVEGKENLWNTELDLLIHYTQR